MEGRSTSASTLNADPPQVIKMKIVLTTKQRKQLLKVFAYIEGLDPEGSAAGLVRVFEEEDHALDKLYEKLLG